MDAAPASRRPPTASDAEIRAYLLPRLRDGRMPTLRTMRADLGGGGFSRLLRVRRELEAERSGPTVQAPVDPMIVTAPPSPTAKYEIITGVGTLTPLMYAYGVSAVNADGEEGPPANWVFPQITKAMGNVNSIKLTWLPLEVATQYKVYGRKASDGVGLMATINAGDPLEFTDDGSITPGAPPPGTVDVPIRYNKINNLTVNVVYAERQQRIQDTPTRLA